MAFQALQDEAAARAKAAVQRLPHGDVLFQQCAGGNISIETVLETIRHKAASTRRKKASRVLDTFHRTTAWMLNIAPSIDVAVNASAGIACPVWAPIKFVLMAVRENATAIEKILEVVQHIADNLVRLDLYKQFQHEPPFQVALVNLFADITEFSIRAYQLFKRKTLIRVGVLIGRNFKDDFESIISSVHRRTKTVDDTATALHQQWMQSHIEGTLIRTQQESRVRTMQWLRPSNTREYHDQRLSLVVENTCHWILSNATFCQWMKDPHESSNTEPLIIHGRPGSGKSVLASFIFSMLDTTTPEVATEASIRTPDHQAYTPLLFSFSSSDTERQTLASMLRTLLSQILEHDEDNATLDLICKLQERSSVSTSDLFHTIGEALILFAHPVLVILDGVDECSDATALLFSNLAAMSQKAPRLKTLLLGQSQSFTRFFASNPNARTIMLGPEFNREDINAVVDAEMKGFQSQWDLSVCGAIAESLKEKADGMFLWVRLMVDYLSGASCESELYACLDNLPEGLDETYTLLLDRLLTRISKQQKQILHRVLSLFTTSGRPLQLSELRLAYALMTEPEDNLDLRKTESYILRLHAQDLVELCGGFVTYSDDRFHIVHNSAREYLTTNPYTTATERPSLAVFKINITDSHNTMSRVCMKVFRDSDESESSESFLESRTALRVYASLYTAYHLNNSGRTREQLQKSVAELFESTQFFQSTEEMTPQLASDASLQFIEESLKLWRTLYPDATEPQNSRDCSPETSPWISKPEEEDDLDEIEYSSLAGPSGQDTPPMALIARNNESHWRVRNEPGVVVIKNAGTSLIRDSQRYGPRQTPRSRVFDHSRKVAMTLQPHDKGANAMRTARYFNLSMKLFKPLFVGKALSDPMKILFNSVRRAAPSMPPSLMAAIAWYYFRMMKYQEAYEIGSLCAEKMRPNDTLLRMLLELLVGHAAYYLDKFAESIPYLEYAFQNAKRIPSFTHDATDFILNLVDAYRCSGQHERALEVLKTFLQSTPTPKLDEEDQLRVHYNLGICQWFSDDLEAAIANLVSFHKGCEAQEEDPLAEYPDWPSKHYLDTHYTLGQCLFNAYRDQEALAALEQFRSLRESRNFILGGTKIIHKSGMAYNMALEYAATETEDAIKRFVLDQCHLGGCGQCFQNLRERMNVYDAILREDHRSQRAFSTATKYLEVFEAVHSCDRNPCKAESGHAWYIAQRYSIESEFHYLVGNSAGEVECLWKALEIYNEHDNSMDYDEYLIQEDFESFLGILSWRLSESNKYEDLLLATLCVQASTQFSLHRRGFPRRLSERIKNQRDRLRSRTLDFQRRLWTQSTPTLMFQPATADRIAFLQRTIDLHFTRETTKRLFGTTEALIDHDAWDTAQDRYLVRGWVEWRFQNEAELPKGMPSTVRNTPNPIFPRYGLRRLRLNPLNPLSRAPILPSYSSTSSTSSSDEDDASV